MIERSQSPRSLKDHFPHVRHVKKACLFPHRHVLGNDALSVLHRHDVASEGDHLSSQRHVPVIKRRFLVHICLSFLRNLFHPAPFCFWENKKGALKNNSAPLSFDLKDRPESPSRLCFFGVPSCPDSPEECRLPVLLPESFIPFGVLSALSRQCHPLHRSPFIGSVWKILYMNSSIQRRESQET